MTTTTSAKIVADSVSPAGHRLTTFECTFPRIILAEVNTHKMLSKNSASSRAIPIEKMIKRVLDDPYIPEHWGKNQRGMQATEDVHPSEVFGLRGLWWGAASLMIAQASELLERGIHKQITNRLLEPFMWHTALISGTEYSNFFNLRDNKDAHPDFRDLAHAMRELYSSREPTKRGYQDWHTPLALDEDLDGLSVVEGIVDWDELRCKVSVGRCARVSYLTHDGKRDPQADIDLCDRLLSSGHMSPFEHVARPMTEEELSLFCQKTYVWDAQHGRFDHDGGATYFLGNVQGWVQYRKLIPHEGDILGDRS